MEGKNNDQHRSGQHKQILSNLCHNVKFYVLE
jgi:hypothetical protein